MTSQTTQQADGLTFAAYPGDGAVLLAFDVGQGMEQDLAGFAVEYTDPDGQTFPVLNRLGFKQAITSATTPEQRQFFPTGEAPLQKFHWVHFPPDVKPGTFTYKATAMLFQPGSETALIAGPSAEVGVVLMPPQPGPFQLGFTSATSSVLFAIMEIGAGTGPLLDAIRALPSRPELYGFGTTQRLDGSLKVEKSGDPADTTFIPFSYLSNKVPAPFRTEWNGGMGQVIHHKFVVTDFNGDNPLVFAGSSNLAAGGEEQNGDNLVCFTDRDIATRYAIEAIQLVDHYRFRAVMQKATDAQPLQLQGRSAHWASDYYTPGNPKFRERTLLAGH